MRHSFKIGRNVKCVCIWLGWWSKSLSLGVVNWEGSPRPRSSPAYGQ